MTTPSGHSTTVIYHEGCHDGFTAAYAAWLSLGQQAAYIPSRYGQRPPELQPGSRLYILDFSYPRDTTIQLGQQYHLTLLDHHQTAEEQLQDITGCLIDTSKSGAVLAWENFFPNHRIPPLMSYVQDADLWKWQLPHSRAITAYIASFNFEFQQWANISTALEQDFAKVVAEGEPILRYQEKLVAQLAARATTQKVAGHRVPTVNAPILQSEVAHKLLDLHPKRAFAAVYSDTKNTRKWSLRSRQNFDVARIAEQYGGGGHPGASGFTHRIQTGSPRPSSEEKPQP